MRYRDQPTVEVETRVSADPADVWAYVTDITVPARSSEELFQVEWLEGDEVAVGNRFRGHNRNPHLGEWSTDCTIVEVEPGRRWTWEVRAGGNRMATWGWEVDPASDGALVRQWGRMGPDPSGINIAIDAMPEKEGRILSRRMQEWRTNMEANLAALREHFEGTA
jgi:hypothetical protein